MQLMNSKEELQLPLYFYLEPEINDDPILSGTKQIKVIYKFFKSKNQNLAKLADEELKRVQRNKEIIR